MTGTDQVPYTSEMIEFKEAFIWPDLLSTEQAISSMEKNLKLLIHIRNKSRPMVRKPSTTAPPPPLATDQNPPNTATAYLQADASKTKVNTSTKSAAVDKKKDNLQEVLRNMRICEEEYEWKKVPGGWECKGGTHKVSDAQVASRTPS